MKSLILLALLTAQQPEQNKQEPAQTQVQTTACSLCDAPQAATKLTPEAKTLCHGCFERLKFLYIPS
jgi:hypothetical protein